MLTIKHQKNCIARTNASVSETQAVEISQALKQDSGYAAVVTNTALDADLETLSAITSIAEKVEFKKQTLLPKYLPQVEAYIESGARKQYEPLFYCAMWCFDAGDLTKSLALFECAIEQQQIMPARFKRSMTDLAVELVAEWAEEQVKKQESAAPYLPDVCEKIIKGSWIVDSPIILGKAFKSLGLYYQMNDDKKLALQAYQQAQDYNDKAGCKGRINTLKRALGL